MSFGPHSDFSGGSTHDSVPVRHSTAVEMTSHRLKWKDFVRPPVREEAVLHSHKLGEPPHEADHDDRSQSLGRHDTRKG